jgi:hypothetical protein
MDEIYKMREENKILQQQLLDSTKLIADLLKSQSNTSTNTIPTAA